MEITNEDWGAMDRTFIGCMTLMVLGCFAVQPAQAKDRKSAPEDGRALAEMVASREAQARPARDGSVSASVDRTAGAPAMLDRSTVNRNGTPTAPLREQQAPGSNALSLKLGAVTVRPAVGGIKGAQFSIGF